MGLLDDSLNRPAWHQRGGCVGRWELFEREGRVKELDPLTLKAAHICKHHCPVFAECLAWTHTAEGFPSPGVIQAGHFVRSAARRPNGTKVRAALPDGSQMPYGHSLKEIREEFYVCEISRRCRPAAEKVTNMKHGTRQRYRHGCMCDPCREAGVSDNRRIYQGRKARAAARQAAAQLLAVSA